MRSIRFKFKKLSKPLKKGSDGTRDLSRLTVNCPAAKSDKVLLLRPANAKQLGIQSCRRQHHLYLIGHEPASHGFSGVVFALESNHTLQKIRDLLRVQALFDLAIAFSLAFLARVGPRPVSHLFGVHGLSSFILLGSLTTMASTHGMLNIEKWNVSTYF
jgi:hypothetical protein